MSHPDRYHGSWLCSTPAHRERFLEMQERLRVARTSTMIGAALIAVFVAPHATWALAVMATFMLALVVVGSLGLERRRRPELWVFFTTVLNIQICIAAAALLSGGPQSVLIGMFGVPVIMVAARFSNQGLLVGTPISVALLLAVTLGADADYVKGHPESLIVPLVTVVCTAAYLAPLVASDVRHRADSTLDALTGLLNRRALPARFAEVADQAAIADRPISVVLADVDHFKRINDVHGHATGDEVLQAVANALRGSLRTFELLYRIGGEEFLLLLPGADASDAIAVAESLRSAVADAGPAGLDVTCSFGVATTGGPHADADALLAQADTALYEAKRLGRNRVCHAREMLLTPVA